VTDLARTELCGGSAVFFSEGRPEGGGLNEDAGLVAALPEDAGVLAVADGAGGQAAGARASGIAIERLHAALRDPGGAALRESILRGFDEANRAVLELGIGAATTLALVEISERSVRAYHSGDSLVLVVGQRGKRKLETIAHSPVGYAVEAGLLDENAAMQHEDRHVVSNLLGLPGMRVEMSARLPLAARDTVLLATDGLSDNLHVDEIVALVRKGPLDAAAAALATAARGRMTAPTPGQPSKPDDLTFLLFRLG